MKFPYTSSLKSSFCLIILFAFFCTFSRAELSRAEFEKLTTELQPDPKASWRKIPWKISVLEAGKLAAAEKKPIFIWAMDGHPLGCT